MTDSNCPNCGAPAKGLACEYCGTMLKNPQEALTLAIGKTVSVSFEHDGRLYEFDMQLDNVRVDASMDPAGLYSDGMLVMTICNTPEYEASMSGRLVPSVKHGGEGLLFYRELAPDEVTC